MPNPAYLALPLALLLGSSSALAQGRPPAQPARQGSTGFTNRIVAVVNGDAISSADIESRRRLLSMSGGGGGGAQGNPQRVNDQILRLLIDERLRLQEISRRRIPVSDQDVADAIGEIESRNGMGRGGLVASMRRSGIEVRALYDQIRVQIGWGRLLRQILGPNADPSEAEVRDFVANARAHTGQPEFLIGEIFIPINDPAQEAEARSFTDEVIRRLRAGTAFAAVATQFSQSPNSLQGGDRGWVRAEQLEPEIARIVQAMPEGAISNPIRVPGGWQIVTLRQRRVAGRDNATILNVRQVFLPFQGALDPNNPTPQQRQTVERAQALHNAARGCEAMDAAARGSPRPADPGEIRLESINPPALRQMLASLPVGRASQPVIAPDGVMVLMVCSRDSRNMAEVTPEQARATLIRDRVELASRQLQGDLRRRAQIEMRGEPQRAPTPPAAQQPGRSGTATASGG